MGGDANKDKTLPLASHEYHQLCEMLIFYIELPARGMQSAQSKLQQMPLPAKIRSKFITRLQEIRNMVVADVQVSKGEPIVLNSNNGAIAKNDSNPAIASSEEEKTAAEPAEQQVNPFVEALIPMSVRNLLARVSGFKRRIRTVLVFFGLVIIILTLFKKGFITALMRTRVVKALARLLFNYEIGVRQ